MCEQEMYLAGEENDWMSPSEAAFDAPPSGWSLLSMQIDFLLKCLAFDELWIDQLPETPRPSDHNATLKWQMGCAFLDAEGMRNACEKGWIRDAALVEAIRQSPAEASFFGIYRYQFRYEGLLFFCDAEHMRLIEADRVITVAYDTLVDVRETASELLLTVRQADGEALIRVTDMGKPCGFLRAIRRIAEWIVTEYTGKLFSDDERVEAVIDRYIEAMAGTHPFHRRRSDGELFDRKVQTAIAAYASKLEPEEVIAVIDESAAADGSAGALFGSRGVAIGDPTRNASVFYVDLKRVHRSGKGYIDLFGTFKKGILRIYDERPIVDALEACLRELLCVT